jgi:hypothetical protein
MSTGLYLTLRVVHVLLAALWIGSTVFISLLLMPAIEMSGPAGGQVMVGLNRRGINAYMGAIGGITVLTGILLFWRYTAGFDPVLSGSRAGISYSIGGLAGLLAVIVGGAVVGRSAKKVMDIMQKAGPMAEGPERGRLMQEAAGLRQRLKTFGAVVILLQLIALVTMTIAHLI